MATFPSGSRRRPVIAAACLLAAVALLAASAGAGADGSRPRQGEEPNAAPCPEAKVEFCEGYVDDFIEAQRLTERVGRQIGAMLGDRFGGMWSDRTDYYPNGLPQSQRRIHYAVAGGPTPEDEARLREITGGNRRIVLTPVVYSVREMEAFGKPAEEIVARHHPRHVGAPFYCVDLWHHPQAVMAQGTAPLPPAMLAELEAAVPPDLLRVFVHPDFCVMRFAHTTRVDYPPYEAGLGLTMVPPAP